MQEADLPGQAGARLAVDHRHPPRLQIGQRGGDVRRLEAEVMQSLAALGEEAAHRRGRPQRLQQLDLALAGRQQRGPHALLGDLRLAHQGQAEDVPIEPVGVAQTLHHDSDVMNPPHHLGILP